MYQLEHGCVQVIIVLLFKQEQLHQLHYLSSLVPEQEEPLCLSVWPNLLLLCSIAPSFLLLRFLFHPLPLSQVNHNFTLRNPRFNSVSWVFVNCFGWEGVLNNWRYILYLKQESGLIWYWVGFGLVWFCFVWLIEWFGLVPYFGKILQFFWEFWYLRRLYSVRNVTLHCWGELQGYMLALIVDSNSTLLYIIMEECNRVYKWGGFIANS